MPAQIASSRVAASPFGALLREWRAIRRLSQLELALSSGISARHLSFAETGRSHPSRETVQAVATALDMPLSERNALLVAAGYAPAFAETRLDAPELKLIRQAIDLTLDQHEPFPAFALNRRWDVLSANRGLHRVMECLRPGGPKHGNIVRQVFDPDDMRPYIENWSEVAGDVLSHLRHAVRHHPTDTGLRALLEEALSYGDIPSELRQLDLKARPLPIIVSDFRKGELRLSFFSTLTRFAMAADVAVQDTSIECMFPADEATRKFCISAAVGAA